MTQDSTPDPGNAVSPADTGDTSAAGGDEQLMEIVVSVDDAHLPAMTEMVSALESAGMMIDQTMPVLGTVAGRIPPTRLADIGLVEGVAAIEESRSYQLPPPDSDVQ